MNQYLRQKCKKHSEGNGPDLRQKQNDIEYSYQNRRWQEPSGLQRTNNERILIGEMWYSARNAECVLTKEIMLVLLSDLVPI